MTDPTDRSPLEARLRATLAAAAPADTHLEGGLADLRGRLDGTVLPLARRPRPSRLLLTAAAVLAVAALATGGIVVAMRDDHRTVTSTSPDDPDVTTSLPAPGSSGPAAWYIPKDLPQGWKLDGVSTDYRNLEGTGTCPCRTTAWTSPDGELVTIVGRSTSSATFDGLHELVLDPVPIDLGGGVEGQMGQVRAFGDAEASGAWVVAWIEDGAGRSLNVAGQSEEEAVAVARRLVVDIDAPPADGWTVLSDSTQPGGVGSYDSVDIGFITPSGARVGYQLFPAGLGDQYLGTVVPERYQAEGQIEPLLRFDFPARSYDDGEEVPAATVLTGQWPGGDLLLGPSNQEASEVEAGTPAFDELLLLAASLRPATAEEWAAFLDTAPPGDEHVPPDVPRSGALADLVRAPGVEPGD